MTCEAQFWAGVAAASVILGVLLVFVWMYVRDLQGTVAALRQRVDFLEH